MPTKSTTQSGKWYILAAGGKHRPQMKPTYNHLKRGSAILQVKMVYQLTCLC